MDYNAMFPAGEWSRFLLVGQTRLEMWAGIECTVNRVRDEYFDQLRRGGHWERLDDLDRIAALGIRKLRYPVLWEHHAGGGEEAWAWADARLQRLRALHVEPIVGLEHHGSGPPHTSLLDPGFPAGLAAHAEAVARRYPWVEWFTPINEPLTTARFSALYGHWYPHARDDRSFVRALLLECEATRRAMRAIRAVNPAAKLVQTEDLGRTYSTSRLAYQARFDNGRRWLSLDLLCGLVGSDHPFWKYFRDHGASAAELESWVREPCPPDIIGINYYITGERFLDHRLERYPGLVPGGNGREPYVDVEAVRVSKAGIAGVYGILKEAWARYELPLAVTEAHLGCTREEQLRWLMETWESAQQLLAEGADVRAVTAWSVLGAFDWNSLLTRFAGHYEPGAFDVRGPQPRPTAIARCIQHLAQRGTFEHPVLARRGWWRRRERLLYLASAPYQKLEGQHPQPRFSRRPAQELLITGATGTLGQAFQRLAELRGLDCRVTHRRELDIARPEQVRECLEAWRPWAVINTAGYVRVDAAEADAERCWRENVHGPVCLAEACAAAGIPLLSFSSDLVFDGAQGRPYVESDPPHPLGVYGHTKAEAERRVLEILPAALIVRTSAFFGPWDAHNFVTQTVQHLLAGEPVNAVGDAVVSPTYVPDLVNACLDLLLDEERGIWHVANSGAVTWADWARTIARRLDRREDLVEETTIAQMAWAAQRPTYSALGTERGQLLPPWEDALDRYLTATASDRDDLAGQCVTKGDAVLARD